MTGGGDSATTAGGTATGAAALAGVRVDRRTIDRLFARRLISAAARDHALSAIDHPRAWGPWTARLLTVVGVALMLAGIVYFFAFNWAAVPAMAKLGGIALGTALAIGGAVALGLDHAAAGVLVTVATVLVGVFLAVFGQIYQTGADAWQLFAGWAALTLVWALMTASAATWAVWIAVADVAIVLWWEQTQPFRGGGWSTAHGLVAVVDAGFLAAREILVGRGVAWPAGRWTRIVLVVATLTAATIAVTSVLIFRRDGAALDTAVAGAAGLVLVAAAVVYRRALPDPWALAAAVTALCVVIDVAFYNLIARATRVDAGILFLNGVFTIGLFAVAVAWLRAAARTMEARHG